MSNYEPPRRRSAPAATAEPAQDPPVSIAKPASKSNFDKFRSKQTPSLAGVETLLAALPHHNVAQANDCVRLRPDEGTYWSSELAARRRTDCA